MIAPSTAPPARPLRVRAVAWIALAALLAGAGATLASDFPPVGPPIGNNRYKTRIERGPQTEPDTDDYIGLFAAGDRLSITVKSPFQSPLLPTIQIIDPDGIDRTTEAEVSKPSEVRRRSVKRFPIDKTGHWIVRIGSILDTEGPYSLAFQVRPARKSRTADHRLGGSEPLQRVHEFAAIGGSSVDVQVAWDKNGAPVEIVSVEAPGGGEVLSERGATAGESAKTGKRATKLKKFHLGTESGVYAVRVRAGDETSYGLTLRVRAPKRPGGKKKLSPVEPSLDPPEFGVARGVAEMTIRLRGWNFSAASRPLVLFGDTPGTEVIVHPSGGYLDVIVPEGIDDTFVPVSVTNPDGQASAIDDYFYYVPPPVITDVTDVLGNPVRGADAAGGSLVRVVGEHLVSGQIVLFGDSPELVPILRDGTLEVRVPAKDPGGYEIKVTDAYEHEAVAPFSFELKAAPRIDADPYTPAVATAGVTTDMLLRGRYFEESDTLRFDGEPTPFILLSSSLIRFEVPVLDDGLYPLEMEDRFGLVGQAPDLRVKSPGVIDAVRAVDGPRVADTGVSIHGGTTVAVDGSLFDGHDRIGIAGTTVDPSSSTDSSHSFVAPGSSAGLVDVTVTDAAGQAVTATEALRYQGYADGTALRTPARTSVDDFSALRGAAGDLDQDGSEDDVVIVSHASPAGTRARRMRVLLGQSSGKLADRTGTTLPLSGSDSTGTDDWRAQAVVLGDLDPASDNGPEILIAGVPADATRTGELRLFRNDGTATFTLDENAVPGSTQVAGVTATDENGTVHVVFGPRVVAGAPSAIVVGDLDGDDDLDVVIGRTAIETRLAGVDEAYVDFTGTTPYVNSDDAAAHDLDTTLYFAATRVLENDIDGDGAFVDVTDAALPSVGDAATLSLPAFHARDLALGDLDDDGDLDLVVTWDDPTTVTAYGLKQGSGTVQPTIATRVLLNDGAGVFTDATSTWMPAASAPEFFHATRLALTDLDGNGHPDLVLAHAAGVDAYQGPPGHNRYALRVLSNDGSGFTDITSSALPALPKGSNEDFRADALHVGDVDGDGVQDILLGSLTAPRTTAANTPLRGTRLLLGESGGVTFRDATGFLPPRTSDSGQAEALVFLPDLAGNARPSLLLLTETVPAASARSSFLRLFDWER